MAARSQPNHRPGIVIDARKYGLAPAVEAPQPEAATREIFYYGLDGKFKKIRGLFTGEEAHLIMEALRKANYQNPFFGALYCFPQGQFGSDWTYA